MDTYRVTLHVTYDVEAENREDAETKAMEYGLEEIAERGNIAWDGTPDIEIL